MKQDKALQKVLSTSLKSELPYGFDQKVMNKVFVEAERQAKQKFALSMALVSMVSISIISATVFVLYRFYSISLSIKIPQINFSSESKSIFWFSVYIASIVMFLLGMDAYLRRLRKKIE